jgi:predicted AAA+ superfamily ATPase
MSLKKGSVVRFFSPPKSSYFLLGPRGTGKSTAMRAAYPTARWLDLLDPALQQRYQAQPERLREFVEAEQSSKIIVIDEIQKIPKLLDVVHALIEEKRGYQFILTGSSARKLKRTGADLLAGRAVMRSLHPFMAAELEKEFDLKNALRVGLLPLVCQAPDSEDILRSYVALYIREEVQMEGLVRNLGRFSRFLEAVSFSHGSPLNMNAIAQECAVDRKSVENYVGILEDLLLAYRIPVFTKRAKRELSAHPKFYFFDPGVFRSLRPQGPLDHVNEIDGHALEGLVAEHLRAWIDYGQRNASLSFWRTRSGSEVDFVIYGPNDFVAIEVKNSSRLRNEDLRGLNAFKDDYPEADVIFLYRGSEKLKRGRVLCWPCEDFLRRLRPERKIVSA